LIALHCTEFALTLEDFTFREKGNRNGTTWPLRETQGGKSAGTILLGVELDITLSEDALLVRSTLISNCDDVYGRLFDPQSLISSYSE
jgi:hypothetical protein